MTRFQFLLERVLELRRSQLELEEARFQQHAAAVAGLNRLGAENQSAGLQAETEVRSRTVVDGCDLARLDGFRLRVRQQAQEIASRLVQCQQELGEQRGLMMEARRRVRLLERLRERREAEWRVAASKELDETASESFLARWARER